MTPLRLTARFRLESPMLLGGPENDDDAVLRSPPWKGALRFWMRTLIAPSLGDTQWQHWERQWCGAHPVQADKGKEKAGGPEIGRAPDGGRFEGDMRNGSQLAGRAPWSVRVRPVGALEATWRFDSARYKPLQSAVPASGDTPASWINGVPYCLYPLTLPGNLKRRAFPAGGEVEIELVVLRPEATGDGGRALGLGPDGRRALLGAVWLLGHLGAIGMRASRGAGSVTLTRWSVEGLGGSSTSDWDDDMAALRLGAAASRVGDWVDVVRGGLETLERWFPTDPTQNVATPHLRGAARSIVVVPSERHQALGRRGAGRAFERWEMALDNAGGRLQLFRRRDRRSRDQVLFQLLADVGHRDGEVLRTAPGRAQFGLPLSFKFAMRPQRYRSALRGVELDLRPDLEKTDGDRFASPLRLRLVSVGSDVRAVVVRLGGALPGEKRDKRDQGAAEQPPAVRLETSVTRRGELHTAPGEHLLDTFMVEVSREPDAAIVL